MHYLQHHRREPHLHAAIIAIIIDYYNIIRFNVNFFCILFFPLQKNAPGRTVLRERSCYFLFQQSLNIIRLFFVYCLEYGIAYLFVGGA